MSAILDQPESGKANGEADQKLKSSPSASRRKRSNKNARKGRGASRKFPQVTLEQALAIPNAIKKYNAGNPWPPAEVAKVLEIGPKSPKFWYLSSGAREYGITDGTRDTATIGITPLGKNIVYAASAEVEAESIRQALFNIELFKSVYEYYKGDVLPEVKYLANTLETTFHLPAESHTEFSNFYAANREFLNRYFGKGETDRERVRIEPGENSHLVVVGQPEKKTKLVAFVAMPFSEKSGKYPKGFFDEVLKNVITPAAVEAGFKVETARKDGSDIIQSTIVNDLLNADLVIADLTEHNPNVLFELGLRMVSEKPIAIIRANGTAPIFDVDNMLRVCDYDPNLWPSTLQVDVPKLAAHIKGTWEKRETSQTYMSLFKSKVK